MCAVFATTLLRAALPEVWLWLSRIAHRSAFIACVSYRRTVRLWQVSRTLSQDRQRIKSLRKKSTQSRWSTDRVMRESETKLPLRRTRSVQLPEITAVCTERLQSLPSLQRLQPFMLPPNSVTRPYTGHLLNSTERSYRFIVRCVTVSVQYSTGFAGIRD